MKLAKLLTELEKLSPELFNAYPPSPLLSGKNLETELILTLLKSTDEFKDADLRIMPLPVIEAPADGYDLSKDSVLVAKTMLLQKSTRFIGKVFLYAITTTPKMYETSDFTTPVKNGCGITPVLYDPEQFLPIRRIIMEFNPVSNEDVTDAVIKTQLIEKLKHVLDNPKEYEAKGHRGIMVRGVFEVVEYDEAGGKETF